ncbi:zinc finger CCHC domain-containing protein 7 [Kryptolebias marmoratus]|uniref:Zinc finger CCHC domain-containing protein 7 n=1 Tax=Kryptolebias marmoratus TaxID=37003 RepID=A0A3Q2Z9E1_KRYMA|nr:zinc finger CCHC domain-containing protein 7 [Kryptolebias marmoratus]XP_017262651.1 zinc finger CCHC domain-containing protein 7 [Kryptolebias marmoratus]XP_037830832.1 zinc finger CCHC domain-containing protein 7 [Kryptolebias marmoratus]
MYSAYQARKDLEDDLYHDGDSEVSEVNSELEFHLYSQLHYSSNAAEIEELGDDEEKENDRLGLGNQQHEVLEMTEDGDSKLSSSQNDGLRQNKRKKVEKQKKKKKKTDSKGQKLLSSSVFEEVIVIDSSPDVISISEDETSGDDEGICAVKGRGSSKLLTSTPAQQENQKRKRSPVVPVTVVSSSSAASESESESESSESDSSDSDGLENWMMLDQGMQDGDQSISLNLKGGSDSSTDAEDEGGGSWLVSEKDMEAQIYNKDRGSRITVQRASNRYYTGKNVHCKNCNRTGHLSKNCPDPKRLVPCFLCGTTGHLVSDCPKKHCNNCGHPGHLFSTCHEKAYWYKQCHRCSMKGHFLDACPEIWRQYHITTKSGPPVKQQREDKDRSPAYCFNCSKKGHFGFACTRQRMFSGVYPSSPFISHYDSVADIKRRQHRTKLKVNEMRRSGHLPALSPTPHAPEAPKKKQKISHHTNNHQPNKTPGQTPNEHKPSPSHIFFSDSDFSKTASKTKSFRQQQGVGSVKPWKPKRPVPTSRDPLPSSKLALGEDEDLPRGGGMQPNKKKKKKVNKTTQVSLFQPQGHKGSNSNHLCRTVGGGMQRLASNNKKGEKRKNWKNYNNKKVGAQLYPEDDDLFIIKQRKRRR